MAFKIDLGEKFGCIALVNAWREKSIIKPVDWGEVYGRSLSRHCSLLITGKSGSARSVPTSYSKLISSFSQRRLRKPQLFLTKRTRP